MEISSSFGGEAAAAEPGTEAEGAGAVVQAANGSSSASAQVRRTEVIHA